MTPEDLPRPMMRASVQHHVAAAALALGLLGLQQSNSAAEGHWIPPEPRDPKTPDDSDVAAQMRAERARRKAEAFQKRQQK